MYVKRDSNIFPSLQGSQFDLNNCDDLCSSEKMSDESVSNSAETGLPTVDDASSANSIKPVWTKKSESEKSIESNYEYTFAKNLMPYQYIVDCYRNLSKTSDPSTNSKLSKLDLVVTSETCNEDIDLESKEVDGTNSSKKKASNAKSFLLLLKSFVGTGILFLPNAFHNGGLLFSIVMLFFFGFFSFWCYFMMVRVKVITGAKTFEGIGDALFGKWMKRVIVFSLILTQLGFATAYIIFTAENFKAFIDNVTQSSRFNIVYPLLIQFVIFVPLSFYRNVSKLTYPSLVANGLILAGIVMVIFFSTQHFIVDLHGHPEIGVVKYFNPNRWTMFIGTIIFAFEGVGLIIPVQDAMASPEHFPLILALVLVCTTIMFVLVGVIGYLAYGSAVQPAILHNFPKTNMVVNAILLLYALAILLSTPLQVYPAITLIENAIFRKNSSKPADSRVKRFLATSGGADWRVKTCKNVLRTTILALLTLFSYWQAARLESLVAIIGSVACIPLVYTYPALLHLKGHSLPRLKGRYISFPVVLDVATVVFGISSTIYTTYQSIVT